MAHARPTADPVTAVRQYIDAFNKGDVKAMAACFAVSGSILDGLAPHVWHGPAACQDWYRDVLVAAEHEGATDNLVTIALRCTPTLPARVRMWWFPQPWRSKYTASRLRNRVRSLRSLRQHDDGWRIAARAWTKGTPIAT
jgi:hypothetical protein